MKRGYFLTDSLDEADKAVEILHQLHVDDSQIHILSKDRQGVQQHHLHGSQRISEKQPGSRCRIGGYHRPGGRSWVSAGGDYGSDPDA